ncbi:MAG: hypothetical protein ABEJ67_00025 [Halanaeroarchaeum sp.]
MRRATGSVADVVTLAGCAHMAMHDDPEQFDDAVRDALDAR